MSALETFTSLVRAFPAHDLARHGATFYSSAQTLRPGSVYLLGTNPGGDEGSGGTLASSLEGLPKLKNEYFHGKWDTAGSRRLQEQVKALLRVVAPGCEQDVCASNLIYFRSSKVDDLTNFKQDARRCWPAHEFVLDTVSPRMVIAFGNGTKSAYGFLKSMLPIDGPVDLVPSGHGSIWCEGFRTHRSGTPMFVVGLPHMSRYELREGGELRPPIAEWLRYRLQNPMGEACQFRPQCPP